MIARQLAETALSEAPWRTARGRERPPSTLPILVSAPGVVRAGSVRAALRAQIATILDAAGTGGEEGPFGPANPEDPRPDPTEQAADSGERPADAGEHLAEYLWAAVRTGRAAVLLDAVDEVPAPEALRDALADLEGAPGLVVITSRVGYAAALPAWMEAEQYQLDSWDETEQTFFLRAWGARGAWTGFLEEGGPLSAVGENPLLLALTCSVLEADQTAGTAGMPEGLGWRARLYTRLFDQVLDGGWQADQGPVMADWESVLPETAWRLFSAAPQSNDFAGADVRAALAAASGDDTPEVMARLAALVERGVLQERAPDRWAFAHRTFLEYFVACSMRWMQWEDDAKNERERDLKSAGAGRSRTARGEVRPSVPTSSFFGSEVEGRPCSLNAIAECAGQAAWTEPLRCLAGLLTDPTPLLERLLDPEQDDLGRHRLRLAALCLPEIPRTPGGSSDRSGVGLEGPGADHSAVAGAGSDSLEELQDRIATEYLDEWARRRQDGTARLLPDSEAVLRSLAAVGARAAGQTLPAWAVRWAGRPDQAEPWFWLINGLGERVVSPAFRSVLAEVLRSEDPLLRSRGLDVVTGLGPAVAEEEIAQALLPGLRSPSADEREATAHSLKDLGHFAGSAALAAAVREHILDPDPDVRIEVAEAYGVHTRWTPGELAVELAILAGGEDDELRGRSLHALQWLGAAAAHPEALQRLLPRLAAGEAAVRDTVAEMGKAAAQPDFIRGLLDLAASPAPATRELAVGLLARWEEAAAPHLSTQTVLAWLGDPEPGVRAAAVPLLDLPELADDPGLQAKRLELGRDPDLRVVLVVSDGTEGVEPTAVLPRLQGGLRHPVAGCRLAALRLVSRFAGSVPAGDWIGSVVDALPMLLDDPDPEVRRHACAVLQRSAGRLHSPATVRGLLAQLRSPERHWSDTVAEALEELPPALRTPAVVSDVVSLLESPLANVRDSALGLLLEWGAEWVPALVELLLRALEDEHEDVSSTASSGLQPLLTGEVLPRVLALTMHPAAHIRRNATWVLEWEVPLPPPVEVLAALHRLLEDPDEWVRAVAADSVLHLQERGIRTPRRKTASAQ